MQRSAYQAVLEAHHKAVAMCRPGVRYRDIHLASVKVIAQWLIDENIIDCGLDEAVETGVAALFYPHGVGHLLGLDVHDLEAFGDKAAYAEGRGRSKQFGLGALRMDIDLEPGHVVTIEPGFYVVDAILRSESLAGQHEGRINRAVIEKWRGFGGIRLEDDILVTDDEPENLTLSIPIEINDVEETVGTLNQGQ
jgi:Xaa-Pro aminopeptidase